jgi:5-methyltetrahydropteroyltriglutamate--homocysteine methyltransferase
MSVRTTPPFRADHVGSLLRPRALLQAREDARGTISPHDLRAIEDDAIREAVRMQEQIVKLRLVAEAAEEVWGAQ